MKAFFFLVLVAVAAARPPQPFNFKVDVYEATEPTAKAQVGIDAVKNGPVLALTRTHSGGVAAYVLNNGFSSLATSKAFNFRHLRDTLKTKNENTALVFNAATLVSEGNPVWQQIRELPIVRVETAEDTHVHGLAKIAAQDVPLVFFFEKNDFASRNFQPVVKHGEIDFTTLVAPPQEHGVFPSPAHHRPSIAISNPNAALAPSAAPVPVPTPAITSSGEFDALKYPAHTAPVPAPMPSPALAFDAIPPAKKTPTPTGVPVPSPAFPPFAEFDAIPPAKKAPAPLAEPASVPVSAPSSAFPPSAEFDAIPPVVKAAAPHAAPIPAPVLPPSAEFGAIPPAKNAPGPHAAPLPAPGFPPLAEFDAISPAKNAPAPYTAPVATPTHTRHSVFDAIPPTSPAGPVPVPMPAPSCTSFAEFDGIPSAANVPARTSAIPALSAPTSSGIAPAPVAPIAAASALGKSFSVPAPSSPLAKPQTLAANPSAPTPESAGLARKPAVIVPAVVSPVYFHPTSLLLPTVTAAAPAQVINPKELGYYSNPASIPLGAAPLGASNLYPVPAQGSIPPAKYTNFPPKP